MRCTLPFCLPLCNLYYSSCRLRIHCRLNHPTLYCHLVLVCTCTAPAGCALTTGSTTPTLYCPLNCLCVLRPRRLRIHYRLNHPHIAHMRDAFLSHEQGHTYLNIVMEFIQGGALLEYVNDNKPGEHRSR